MWMGCKMGKKLNVYSTKVKKIVLICLVSAMWIAPLLPTVLADETSIRITFDPDGGIDIDVTPKNYAFGAILGGTSKATTGSTFTLFNNGSVPMDTQLKSNATTDSTEMNLDNDGSPGNNAYSLYTDNLDADWWITNAYGADLDSAIAAGANKGFDLILFIGSSLSSNFTTQATTIYLQGSVS
jgi:hypothetical protein